MRILFRLSLTIIRLAQIKSHSSYMNSMPDVQVSFPYGLILHNQGRFASLKVLYPTSASEIINL